MKLIYTTIFYVLLLLSYFSHAQNGYSKKMLGRIISNSNDIENITIINQTTEAQTLSDNSGNFVLQVSVGDLLFFSAVHLKPMHYTIQKEDFVKPIFSIKLFTRTEELEEVVIEKSKLDAVSLGILSKPAKEFTPAERKLHEATTGGGLVPLNPILNYFSGRTAMLKKEVEIEKNEKSLLRTEYLVEEKYYIDVLKIPVDYVKGFQYYCVEDAIFSKALQTKNKTLAKFLLVDLSKKYLTLLNQK